MEIGDILLFYPESRFTRIISFLTNSDYSHVGIYFGEIDGVSVMYDINGMVLKPTAIKNVNRKYDVYRVKGGLSKENKEKIREFLLDKSGIVHYDYIQLVGFLNRILFGIDNIFNNPDMYVCSELIDLVYQYIGVDLVDKYKSGNVSPADLENSDKIDYKMTIY